MCRHEENCSKRPRGRIIATPPIHIAGHVQVGVAARLVGFLPDTLHFSLSGRRREDLEFREALKLSVIDQSAHSTTSQSILSPFAHSPSHVPDSFPSSFSSGFPPVSLSREPPIDSTGIDSTLGPDSTLAQQVATSWEPWIPPGHPSKAIGSSAGTISNGGPSDSSGFVVGLPRSTESSQDEGARTLLDLASGTTLSPSFNEGE